VDTAPNVALHVLVTFLKIRKDSTVAGDHAQELRGQWFVGGRLGGEQNTSDGHHQSFHCSIEP
jgi:hypothetical protein